MGAGERCQRAEGAEEQRSDASQTPMDGSEELRIPREWDKTKAGPQARTSEEQTQGSSVIPLGEPRVLGRREVRED